ncbi:Lrp/AsnC family transcriptional regulator [Gluconobacter kanchanaburiensis]|uniref:Transcriptional regulator n=1 Tax=Gluconobacter kanchanaburiensis NBRC 103587 TaxID=1307948 RepID=A0A511B7G0_9PROT|nr:Lrp/AsnC family transcriptional regulator [Gluconobacter kanchanaburiensis]MBF0862483.1 Lrp/AsnC family transcriptional regulator [Gluconobacter kanchanaburiensis]GBR68555.1 AsnC family transcriptional regulator [Gluconobacter kanchanaburiensis NBRC 103587]GEK96395.1 transcriptional regulator [Gluconobacter kanchanaburiensis NBRC 103587]
MARKLDQTDRAILRILQKQGTPSQRELAEKVGLSQNACWRRLNALREDGVIAHDTVRLNAAALDLTLTVFVLMRTRHHSREWFETFRKVVGSIPNIVDFYRIAGEYDYLLKVVACDMNDFDRVYQQIISKVELDAITSYITMETLADNRDLPV